MGGSVKTILKQIGKKDMDWIHLSLDKFRWWALVNAVMDLRVP
jgi:hypothetical protein